MDWRGIRYCRSAITFPFFLHCENGALEWPAVEGAIGGIEYVVRAPRLMGDVTRRGAPQFDLSHLMGERAKAVRFMSGFPTMLAADGSAGIQIIHDAEDLQKLGYQLINAVEVDIAAGPALEQRFAEQAALAMAEGHDPLEMLVSCAGDEAKTIARSAMASLRQSTRQYGIDSLDKKLLEWGHLTFAVDPELRICSEPGDGIYVSTFGKDTQLVSQNLWTGAWGKVDRTLPVIPLDLVLNAMQEVVHGNLPACALQAGLAIDLCRHRLWDGLVARGSLSVAERKRKDRNLKIRASAYFADELKECTARAGRARSIKEEQPEIFEALEALYSFRSDAAHARPLRGDPARDALMEFLEKLPALIDFCDDVLGEA